MHKKMGEVSEKRRKNTEEKNLKKGKMAPDLKTT